jgi:hypothetical protein
MVKHVPQLEMVILLKKDRVRREFALRVFIAKILNQNTLLPVLRELMVLLLD